MNKYILSYIICLCSCFSIVSQAQKAPVDYDWNDCSAQKSIFVSTKGNDSNNGSIDSPLSTLHAALDKVKTSTQKDVNIYLREGIYYLDAPEMITEDRIGEKELTITSWQNEKVTLSGSKIIHLNWKKGKGNIWFASVPIAFDQLWINGEAKVLARYPNFQKDGLFNGTSEDALSKSRIHSWKHPEGGFIHSMHSGMWGSQHYLITGKIKDSLTYEGGYQVSRPSKIHSKLRYVENIFEELDTVNEWFLNSKTMILYYYPSPQESLQNADIEVSTTPQLIIVEGSKTSPIAHVTLKNLCFTHTQKTFMKPYEMLMRSDWGIYRGGAVLFENTQDCNIQACEFKELGGNALFISRYAWNDTIKDNHIHHTGGSAICVVGDTSAVRSGVCGYENSIPYENLDLTPGPKNNLYPRQCLIEDNLIHDLGKVEKQVAGVEIQIASMINVRHNTIYDIPRAGINIGDGAFGGHVIEYNDVFNTVLETSDHGAFNSWGRDRYWNPNYQKMEEYTKDHTDLILLDDLYPTIIRFNRFRCDHGLDIDLDDGSSNYQIYNNVCLSGGIKLREGFYRRVENNIVINNSLHPHVWFPKSFDIVRRNFFMRPYAPISLNGWGSQIDYNCFTNQSALEKAHEYKTDAHSIVEDFEFVDANSGDYTFTTQSIIDKIGFINIPMDRFGVYNSSLVSKAKKAPLPKLEYNFSMNESQKSKFFGASVRSIQGMNDQSAFGLPNTNGVIVTEVEKDSKAEKAKLQKNDVVLKINDTAITSIKDIETALKLMNSDNPVKIQIFRNQQTVELLSN